MFLIKEGSTTPGEGTDKKTKESIVSWLEKEGMIVRTKDQEENFLKSKVQDEVDEIMSTRNQQVTDDIKELTGAEPRKNEKWHEFMKRAVKETNEQLTTKISQLEKSNKSGDNDEEIKSLKEQVKDLEKMVSEKEKEIEDTKNTYETEKKVDTIKGRIQKGIDALKSKFKEVDENILNDSIEIRKQKIMNDYDIKETDGVEMIYDKKTNKPIRGKDGSPISLEDQINETFADLVDSSKNKPGGGTGKPGSGSPGGDGGAGDKKWSTIKPKSTTQAELYDELAGDHKMDPLSKDFDEAFTELGKEMPLK